MNRLVWKLTGSIRARVECEVKSHLRKNAAVRTARDGIFLRSFRRVFDKRTFAGFLWVYVGADFLCVLGQYLCSRLMPADYFSWLPLVGTEPIVKDLPIYLITVQAALIAIVAVPVGLITYIGQRDDSTREIQLYYRESLAHEVFSSSIALLVVLTVQLFWPAQLLLHHFVPFPVFEVDFSWIHAAWLVVNLSVVSLFIGTSLRYVDPRERQAIRRSYIVNRVLPQQLRSQLRLYYYFNAAAEILPNRPQGGLHDSVILFGRSAALDGVKEELVRAFRSPTILYDLHIRILGRALRPWMARSESNASSPRRGATRSAPFIGFVPDFDRPMRGLTAWCVSNRASPLTGYEKLLIWAAFCLRRFNGDAPAEISPADLLDDLIGHAIAAIDRSANSAWDRAIDEISDFHGFLLDVHATVAPDGAPGSYSLVPGYIQTPLQEWISPYYRLSQKAVSQISEDTSYATTVAYFPFKLLLARPEAPAPAVAAELLNFFTYYVHRLESWLTEHRRQRAEDSEKGGDVADLPGSDARSYSIVIRKFVGHWRDMLRMANEMMHWETDRHASAEVRWQQFARSWWYSETHLFNSAYLLAAAVQNDDGRGAAAYLDTLIKWPSYLPTHEPHDAMFAEDAMLSPEIVALPWAEAHTKAECASPWPDQKYDPSALAIKLLGVAHDDALLVTGSVFILWCLRANNAAGRIATIVRNVFDRRSDFQESGHTIGEALSRPPFRSLLLQILRIMSHSGHPANGDYGARLDRQVHRMDSLEESDMVPGEIYSPGTIFGQHGLQSAFLCILIARVSDLDPRGSAARNSSFTLDLTKIPDIQAGSFSLESALRRLQQELDNADFVTRLEPVVHAIDPGLAIDNAVARLRQVLAEALSSVEAARAQWLRDAPVAPARLRQIEETTRQYVAANFGIEFVLTTTPTVLPDAAHEKQIRAVFITGQIKGQLIDQPLEPRVASFDTAIAQRVNSLLLQSIWIEFLGRPKLTIDAGVPITSLSFWSQVVRHANAVGPVPFVLLSADDFPSVFRELIGIRGRNTGAPSFQRLDPDGSKARKGYRISVDNLDVYVLGLPPRTVYIASKHQLASMELHLVPSSNSPFAVSFVPQGQPNGEALQIQWAPRIVWADTPIVALLAAPAEGN